jgi:hypothetical protein
MEYRLHHCSVRDLCYKVWGSLLSIENDVVWHERRALGEYYLSRDTAVRRAGITFNHNRTNRRLVRSDKLYNRASLMHTTYRKYIADICPSSRCSIIFNARGPMVTFVSEMTHANEIFCVLKHSVGSVYCIYYPGGSTERRVYALQLKWKRLKEALLLVE